MGKKQVSNPKKSNLTVTNNKSPATENLNLIFDFSYPRWLKSLEYKKFTNMIKNENDFSEYVVHIFTKLIPIIRENWEKIRYRGSSQFTHCHIVAEDKIHLVKSIITEIHGIDLLDDESEESLKYWQIGVGHLRMFAIYNYDTNTIYPVFIDYHHLIHPNKYFNQKDTANYRFCPIEKYS